MQPPCAVVVPFGVPAEGRGLGLGLAALVHAFARVDGGGVAIAQLQARQAGAALGQSSSAEAFLSPLAWRTIAERGVGPVGVTMVLTGAFQPPVDGQGSIALLAFDPRDGRTRAKAEASLDEERAGAGLVAALQSVWAECHGGIGQLSELCELGWDSLESVVHAERCALHDPLRQKPLDRPAALLHLGRAIADCPIARFPVERLVSLSLEVANVPTLDMSVTWAAVRALERALNDAPNRPELSEALGLLHLRVGRPREAERRMAAVIAASPGRGRPYALLSQSFRAQGKLDSAIEAVQAGKLASGDALLSLELGMVLAARGELDAAAIAFREVLSLEHCNCAAFCELAALALRTKDVGTAQWLIDTALSSSDAQAEVYRRAVELALQSEGEGLPRAARIARLCERLLGRVPNDPQGLHWLARALIDLGERGRARARLEQLARVAPNSGAAADAQLLRLSLDDPGADLELKSVLRAAHAAVGSNLGDVAARGRRLGDAHAAWTGFFAAAVAERRRGRFSAARRSLEAALEIAPGAGVVRYELVGVLLALQDANGAVSHAEALLALDWPRANALGLLARSLAAAGRDREAADAAQRALSIQPDDQETRALLIRLHRPPRTHWANRVMRLWTRFNES